MPRIKIYICHRDPIGVNLTWVVEGIVVLVHFMALASTVSRHCLSAQVNEGQISIQSNTPTKFQTFQADLNFFKILVKKMSFLSSHAFCFRNLGRNIHCIIILKNDKHLIHQLILINLCDKRNMYSQVFCVFLFSI